MIDMQVIGLVKAFEVGKNILDGLTFEVRAGERVGLLGKNGAGKTTLFRILTGQLRADEGEALIPPGKRVGLISQIPVYPEAYTGEDVLKDAQREQYALQRELRELEARMTGEAGGALLIRYDQALTRFETLDGYAIDRNRDKIAAGLGISERMRSQPFQTLSGGEKTRMNLARLILENTDILLLDEPTNHLDMRAVQWLETYLQGFRGTVLAISHDRYFLDAVATRCIELVHGRAAFYTGGYSDYVVEKQRRLEEAQRKYEKQQAETKRLTQAADRLAQWGTGNKKLMQKSHAIRSRIERMEKAERPDREKTLRGAFAEKDFFGDELLTVRGLSKAYAGKTLFRDVSLTVTGGERIALVGDNGTGKSTFIRLLVGEERPDSGTIKRGPAVKLAYLPQLIRFEDPSRSMLDVMLYEAGCTHQSARDRLGAFQFRGEDVFTPVSQLSGGEQSRLRLCVLMQEAVNFLILDEPTNHLDIAAREWVETVLEDYDEALLFVSHDRYFINRFATRIWALRDGSIHDFRGSFSAYLKACENDARQVREDKTAAPKERKRKKDGPEKQIARLEREIAQLEEKNAALDAAIEANASDYTKLMELNEEKQALEPCLDGLYEQWETLAAQMEQR